MARNRDPIARVLDAVLPSEGSVLEVASGTGEHTLYLAARHPALSFHPSDPDPEARASIDAWRAHGALTNVGPAAELDVSLPSWAEAAPACNAVLCINMIHIAPWEAAVGLIEGCATLLAPHEPLYLYGPYRLNGQHTAESNARFDESLRGRNPRWGIRDLEAVLELGEAHGLQLEQRIEMPANNQSVILRRG